VRAPLILQTVLGFESRSARPSWSAHDDTAQRLARQEQDPRGIPFHVPERNELPERLDAVLGTSTRRTRRAGRIGGTDARR
jgi:RNA polymerase sigma-70 factor (ECF subfamily)